MSDSFATRDLLSVNGKSYTIYSLAKLGQKYNLARLPYSIKILVENLLRCEDGVSVTKESIEAIAQWDAKKEPDTEIAFMPARVVLQDFTGVPCVVDLAAMRAATSRIRIDQMISFSWRWLAPLGVLQLFIVIIIKGNL